jgi:RNA methyltransferase, TrmH family
LPIQEQITSRNNPKIKQIRALRERKARQESGLVLVEGIHPVGEAVDASGSTGLSIHSLFYAPDLLKSGYALLLIEQVSASGISCFPTSEEVFHTIADKENPQGILALVRPEKHILEQLHPENFPWGVALASPQDPGNLGTVLRTIDAVGASGLILIDAGVDPFHPGVVRASMGTLLWRPIVPAEFADFAGWVKAHGYHLYGTSAHGDLDYRAVDYRKPCILLMGSEREGLTPEQKAVCETVICMPMRGRASSLNLAVATGVMLYMMMEKWETSA